LNEPVGCIGDRRTCKWWKGVV